MCSDPQAAVADLETQLGTAPRASTVFFCSADYDLASLGPALKACFGSQVFGCTTAGEIGSHYGSGGIVAASFSQDKFRIHSQLIQPLDEFDAGATKRMVDTLSDRLEWSQSFNAEHMFAVLLIDGLSFLQESVIASLHTAMNVVPLIGGSAGDSIRFKHTHVYFDGAFHENAAVLTLFESRLPFETFKLQHFEASDLEMIVTEADPERRIVYEINGAPAAEEYAETVGVTVADLGPQTFSIYPLMLQIGDEWYVRSIQKVNPDGSLTFFCAIESGLPLTVARGTGFLETLQVKVAELRGRYPNLECTLGCDCILRRLELLDRGDQAGVEQALNEINFLGFSTYGEQFRGIHINHTLTAVVLGGD
jgi:hypothetical protein